MYLLTSVCGKTAFTVVAALDSHHAGLVASMALLDAGLHRAKAGVLVVATEELSELEDEGDEWPEESVELDEFEERTDDLEIQFGSRN